MYVSICVYVYTCVYIYIYIYMYVGQSSQPSQPSHPDWWSTPLPGNDKAIALPIGANYRVIGGR